MLVTGAAAALVLGQGAAALAAPAVSQQAGQQNPLTAAQVAQLSTHVDQHVIVVLKDQPAASRIKSVMSARSAAISSSQQPLLSELKQVHATHIISYRLVNAFAATVSAGEESRLKANPDVSQVIPDATIQGPASNLTGSAATAKKPKRVKPIAGACLAHGKARLEPEGLSLTGVASSNPKTKTARSLGISGAGETVAYIADGIDPKNVNFIRKDGKSAITVYRDFTGDGTNVPSGAGGEAFGDANTIGGQGRHVYNAQNFSLQGLTEKCNIKIEGVAPGANIEALRVFGVNNSTTTSAFLDAINFATVVDPVNVINESFGENGFPDTSADALKMFDDAAVAAGITVVVSSGDSAPTSTIGSPATDPGVISAAATTDLRSYAISNYGQADMFAKGWLNNSIAPFSSGGFDAYGNTVDVAAPGDSSFASCSTNLANFPECASFGGKALGIELFGGTSESSPWTAGIAALIDQAYKKTHSGAAPSPALVKQIIMSTATNLGAPSYEQGAGLVNAYQAVKMAESVGLTQRTGSTLLTSVTNVSPANPTPRQGQINGLGSPGTPVTADVTVTNTGSGAQTVHLSGRTLGASTNVQHSSVTLSNKHSKKFTDAFGFVNNYGETHFTVKPGQDRLSASIAYPAPSLNFNAAVRFDLINPKGKLAIQSEPQGTSNFTPVDVLHPRAGRWTVVIFDMLGGKGKKEHGTTGKIRFTVGSQKLVSLGHVSTSVLHLASGASGSFTFTASTPSSAGDIAGSVNVNSNSIPVTLRSMVDLATGGHFSGTLTGGNGRDDLPGNGQINYYEFSVPAGSPNVSASVNLTNDGQRQVNAYLVDPAGEIAGFGSNYRLSSLTSSGAANFATGLHMDVYAANAIPGTWTLVVDFNDPALATPSTGNETSQHYTGQIQLKSLVSASASTLPDSASTTLSSPVTVPVTITNNGNATEDFFLDPRLNSTTTYPLLDISGAASTTVPVPLPVGDGGLGWLVPTETSELGAQASSTVPLTFDLGEFGDGADPDIASYTPGSTAGSTTPSLTVSAGTGSLSPGLWAGAPAPPATNGFVTPDKTSGTATFSANAMTQTFDLGALPGQGDFWYGEVGFSSPPTLPDFNPTFSIAPGQSRVVGLTITPSQDGTAGTVVSGTLYVDVFAAFNEIQFAGLTGSDVIGIPYKYTIGS
ncbi:MAG TPA: protease inhibitor I9 family protein [Streptosporangiaceae bacterium]|nr:protease inhibitor I9 family protein [Streptosporangiaceae bacterium]